MEISQRGIIYITLLALLLSPTTLNAQLENECISICYDPNLQFREGDKLNWTLKGYNQSATYIPQLAEVQTITNVQLEFLREVNGLYYSVERNLRNYIEIIGSIYFEENKTLVPVQLDLGTINPNLFSPTLVNKNGDLINLYENEVTSNPSWEFQRKNVIDPNSWTAFVSGFRYIDDGIYIEVLNITSVLPTDDGTQLIIQNNAVTRINSGNGVLLSFDQNRTVNGVEQQDVIQIYLNDFVEFVDFVEFGIDIAALTTFGIMILATSAVFVLVAIIHKKTR